MANQQIHNPNDFSPDVRKLETTDLGHADTFNPLFERLINNDIFLKALIDTITTGAPTNLNTLSEIAAAIANDPNYSTTVNTALSGKVDKVNGKQLSTEDLTTALLSKLNGITASATKTESSTTNGNIKINGAEDIVYTHPSGDGNLHVPATGTTNNGKVLKAGATAGSATWGGLSASEISATSIPGLTGSTVQTLLEALKSYIDAVQQGLDPKQSVRIATSPNDTFYVTYSNNVITAMNSGVLSLYEATEGGVSLAVGDRILVKDMPTQAYNGIYTITSLGSDSPATPWNMTRATDANTSSKLTSGAFVFVEDGKQYDSSGWVMTTTGTITLGTTSINWSQFSGAGQIIAGVGLTKDGNTLAISQGAITDALIGNRTVIDTAAPSGYIGTLQVFLNAFAYMLKAITGKANYYTAPATTLEAANTHINAAAPHTGHAPSGYGLGGAAKRLGAGTDLNSVVSNGWYDVQNPVNGVPGINGGWHNVLVMASGDANYVTQLVVSMTGTMHRWYARRKSGGTWETTWRELITTENMGVGKDYDYQNRIYSNGASDSTAVRYYHDLAAYSSSAVTVTGTLKITLPKSWSSTMFSLKIKGYDYSVAANAWEVVIGAYNYSGSPSNFTQYGASMPSGGPFTSVRLAYDGSKCCVLLGTTSTVWNYPKIAIADLMTSFTSGAAADGWDTGWGFNFITSETGLTNIATCAINAGFRAADITVDGDILATANSTYGQKQLAPSGTWARGNYFFNAAGNTTLGGYGMHGSSDTMDFFYLGFVNQPWNSPAFKVDSTGTATATKLVSTVADGTAPLVVTSKTKVANLNAEQVDGYDVSNGVSPNTIPARDSSGNIAGIANSNGSTIYNISSSGSTYNGYWVPITDVSVTFQYNHAEVRFELFGGATGIGGVFPRATVECRVKQQNPLGQNPIVDLQVSNCNRLTAANFKAVITVTGASSTITIYAQFIDAYENYYVCPIYNFGNTGAWNFYNSQAPLSTPPAGTFQTTAIYKNAMVNTGSGYSIMENGTILQWVYVSNMTNGSTTNVTFPLAFPNACRSVNWTSISPGSGPSNHLMWVNGLTFTACSIYNGTGETRNGFLFAVGY